MKILCLFLTIAVLGIEANAVPSSCGWIQYLQGDNYGLGNCGTNPQLTKSVDHHALWYTYYPTGYISNEFRHFVEGTHGGCAALDGYVYEECWPTFLQWTVSYESAYCGDVFSQVTRNKHAGTYDPEKRSACYEEAAVTWRFDCVSRGHPIAYGAHGVCPSPSPEEDCEANGGYWNFTNNRCQERQIICFQTWEYCGPGQYWNPKRANAKASRYHRSWSTLMAMGSASRMPPAARPLTSTATVVAKRFPGRA